MALLDPVVAILDETDSGLDIDALRIVAGGVNQLAKPRQRHPADHPLPALAGCHHPGLRPRDGSGADAAHWRQRTGPGAWKSAATTGWTGARGPGGGLAMAMPEGWLTQLPAPAGTLEPVQRRGRLALSEQSFPTRRQEAWRLTDLTRLEALFQAVTR
jgi:hypothetical protein